MEHVGETQKWNTDDWIDALSRSTDKPIVEYCENQNGTTVHIRAVQGHSLGANINPTSFWIEADTVELEGTQIPQGHLFQLWIHPGEWFMRRRIDSEKHKTNLFHHTSKSARFVIATANDRMDKTRSWTKNGPVQPKWSPRPQLYWLRQSSTCSQRKLVISSK